MFNLLILYQYFFLGFPRIILKSFYSSITLLKFSLILRIFQYESFILLLEFINSKLYGVAAFPLFIFSGLKYFSLEFEVSPSQVFNFLYTKFKLIFNRIYIFMYYLILGLI